MISPQGFPSDFARWQKRRSDANLRPISLEERLRMADGVLDALLLLPWASTPSERRRISDMSEASEDRRDLDTLLRRHASDKSRRHDCDVRYSNLLASRRHAPLRLLEIGLGTTISTRRPTSARTASPAPASARGANSAWTFQCY
jgi:hypothetical protein